MLSALLGIVVASAWIEEHQLVADLVSMTRPTELPAKARWSVSTTLAR
jgi:hypothetical protein